MSSNGKKTTLVRGVPDPDLVDMHALTVLFSPDVSVCGRVIQLPRNTLRVGRDAGDDHLTLDDPLVSRLHASVVWDQRRERYRVDDAGSRNGTELDGREIESEWLEPGDILRIGDTVVRFAHLDLEVVGWAAPKECALKGRSLGLRRVLADIRRVAPTELSVLVLGETGTGKELAAREIHRQSGRTGPFVAVNCAAIPADLLESELFGYVKGSHSGADRDQHGLVQSAERGTLFLDEIGELAPSVQAKLLRVLDEKKVRRVGALRTDAVDVRYVFATNRDLASSVDAGLFRADLYARLNQWEIELPPLRDRPEDLLPIIEETIRLHGEGRPYAIAGDFFEALALHDWPLNVRELVTLVRKALVRLPDGGTFALEHVPKDLRPAKPANGNGGAANAAALPPRGAIPEPNQLVALLRHYDGNVAEVARHTGRERNQVYRWLRRAGIRQDDFRSR